MQKKFRTQFFIVKFLVIIKSKTPIQLCMFYNQQTLTLKGCLVVGPCLVMGFFTLVFFFFNLGLFLVLDGFLLNFFSHLKWNLDVNIQYLYEYVISTSMDLYIQVHT
jgi:hypothetical protein